MSIIIRILLYAALFVSTAQTHAGFFIPKDTTMTMGMYSPDAQSGEIAHGLSKEWSVAGGYHRYKSDDRSKDRRFTILQVSYLLHRGYYTDGVSNVYVFGGPALTRSNELDQQKLGLQGGLWADFETRRIYLRASVQTHEADVVEQTVTTAQALWAPYAADYEDIATWFGVQLQRRKNLSDDTLIIPIVRFFQRTWWVDAGASINDQHRGDLYLNIMLLF